MGYMRTDITEKGDCFLCDVLDISTHVMQTSDLVIYFISLFVIIKAHIIKIKQKNLCVRTVHMIGILVY